MQRSEIQGGLKHTRCFVTHWLLVACEFLVVHFILLLNLCSYAYSSATLSRKHTGLEAGPEIAPEALPDPSDEEPEAHHKCCLGVPPVVAPSAVD